MTKTPKYTRQWLLEEAKKQERIKYLFFWGHQPSKDGLVTASCFSQWWLSEFKVDGIVYKTAEHWMMAGKARLFQDQEVLEEIIACNTPAEAKKLGRKVKNFDQEVWEKECFGLVVQGNVHKFSQHPALKMFLLTTENRVLVEASPVDFIWGIGLAKDNPAAVDPSKWKGDNLLGFALMEVRDRLK